MTSQAMTLPPLAQYKPLDKYTPEYGDFVIWRKWFITWYGVVTGVDKFSNLTVIFENSPTLLLTLRESEIPKHTKKIPLSNIFNRSIPGLTFQKVEKGNVVWYVA